MDWTPKQRNAYVSKHIKRWCTEILDVPPRSTGISGTCFAVLVVLVLLISCPAAIKGIRLSVQMAQGLQAHSWHTVDGTRSEGGYVYTFELPDKAGKLETYTSALYNTHTRLRGDKTFGMPLLSYAWRTPEFNTEPLRVYLHPRDPERSILVPGIPLLAVYHLLALLCILVPAMVALPTLVAGMRGKRLRPEHAVPTLIAILIYLLSLAGASIYMVVWGYLLRTMPPAWPLLVWSASSALLFLCPRMAKWLYGYKVVRRSLYLVLIFGVLPMAAIAAGLSLPYVIAATVAIMVLTVLIKPSARVGNSPLYALLISLVWVPIYMAGLMAPCRALIHLNCKAGPPTCRRRSKGRYCITTPGIPVPIATNRSTSKMKPVAYSSIPG